MSARDRRVPAGPPTADRRVVQVSDVLVFLERDKVALTLTRAELAVVLNALHTVRHDASTLEHTCPSAYDRATLDRAIARAVAVAREQLREAD